MEKTYRIRTDVNKDKVVEVNLTQDVAKVNSGNSSKSFSLLISAITGGILALCMAFCMVWDAVKNGHILTDLTDMGVFILCIGGFIAGSGLTKMVTVDQ